MKRYNLKRKDDPINHLSWLVCDNCKSAGVYNPKLPRECGMCGSKKLTIKNLGFFKGDTIKYLRANPSAIEIIKFPKYELKEE